MLHKVSFAARLTECNLVGLFDGCSVSFALEHSHAAGASHEAEKVGLKCMLGGSGACEEDWVEEEEFFLPSRVGRNDGMRLP